jgi:Scaffold protein Nfu/NifU N terminal
MAGERIIDDTKVEIYNHPNPEIKSFLTTVELSAPRVEIFKKPFDENREDSLSQLPLIGAQIVKNIMDIPGVREIIIKPKEIRMKKETSASWEGIEKKVIEILTSALRRKQIKMVKP